MQVFSVPLGGVETEVQSQVSHVTQLECGGVKIQPQIYVCWSLYMSLLLARALKMTKGCKFYKISLVV